MKSKSFPSLRFAEFNSELQSVKLEDFCTEIAAGKSKDRNQYGHYPLYGSTGIIGKSVTADYNGKRILIARVGANAGSLYLVQGNYGVTDNTLMLSTKEISSLNYLFYYLTNYNIKKLVFGSGQPLITGGQLKGINISVPSFREQTKIADFLTSIDERLQALKKRKELLEQYKNGIMQKLFTQQLRFKDENGKEFPKWETLPFNKLYSFISTNSYSRENLNFEKGEIKNIHYGDIHTKFHSLLDLTKQTVPYINEDILKKNISSETLCKNGDLIIADASEDYEAIGKSIEIVNLNGEKLVAGLHTLMARPDLSKIEIGFGAYIMQSAPMKTQIKKIAQGTKVLSISSTRLTQLLINLPCKSEQAKIIKLLSAIDEKTELVTQQISKTEQYKKGLLPQLFV